MQTEWGIDQRAVSSGAVYADLDNDGDLDLVVNNINQEAFVYRNNSREQGGGSYLAVKLQGKGGNTEAIGAKVYAFSNGMKQYEEVNPARGYLSRVPAEVHFGFGQASKADSLVIIWPDGARQTDDWGSAESAVGGQRGRGDGAGARAEDPRHACIRQGAGLHRLQMIGFGDNDFKRQLLMLFMYSRTGPVIAQADVNKDGREDLYISGDKIRTGRLYLQQPGGKFDASGPSLGSRGQLDGFGGRFFRCQRRRMAGPIYRQGGYSLWEPNTPPLQDQL